jgi:hypothetical protein
MVLLKAMTSSRLNRAPLISEYEERDGDNNWGIKDKRANKRCDDASYAADGACAGRCDIMADSRLGMEFFICCAGILTAQALIHVCPLGAFKKRAAIR